MNRFLPSKKLLVFLITTLVILVCSFIYFGFKNKKISYLTNNQKETTQLINKEVQQTLKNDSDGDGLKDWEEILWKTDPHNSDTDGDGTGDNSEVLAGRNPLIAGPNDFLSKDIVLPEDNQNNYAENKPLTQTDLLSRELFAGYVALKQNNQLGTEKENQFVENLINKNLNSLEEVTSPIYTLNNLKIISSDSTNSLHTYLTTVKSIFQENINMEYELIIVKNSLETKNQKELEKLDTNIKKHQEVQLQLLQTEVPHNLAIFHLEMIKIFSNLFNDIEKMKTILFDPLSGIIGVEMYSQDENLLQEEWKAINLYISNQEKKINN